jgi:diacylglycerol kinase (ATP)
VRRIALIANPQSGAGADRDRIASALRAAGAGEVELFGMDEPERAAASGADRLAVAGGDGTIAPVAHAAGEAGVPVAVIPVGTANDFARGLGVPRRVEAAARLTVHGERTREMELGEVDGRPFVNAASLGLAVAAAERAAPLKRRVGVPAYFLGALVAGARELPLDCRVMADGRELYAGGAWQAIVAATGRFGAGSHVGAADPADGLLEASVLPAGRRAVLPRYALALRSGRIARARGVAHERAREVVVEVPPRTHWNVDGELVEHGSARLRARAGAYRVVVPD